MSWPIADRVFAVNAEGNFKLPGAVDLRVYCDDPEKPARPAVAAVAHVEHGPRGDLLQRGKAR